MADGGGLSAGLAAFGVLGPVGIGIAAAGMGVSYLAQREYQKQIDDANARLEIERGDYTSDLSAQNQAASYGATIEGAPKNITINPVVTISGEFINIGEDGSVGTDSRTQMANIMSDMIVEVVNDAITTGQISLDQI